MKISKISLVYNGSVITGLGLVGVGVWQLSHAASLITVGALILALTLYGAERLYRAAPGGN